MKYIFMFLLVTSFVACNDSRPGKQDSLEKPATDPKADSLAKDIDKGHMFGMGKMGKVTRLQQQAQHLIDSIGKLPAKAKRAAEPYRAKLDSALKDLKYAEFAMEKWMSEFKMDSAVSDAKARWNYLINEKLKVDKMKESITRSLNRADSLFMK